MIIEDIKKIKNKKEYNVIINNNIYKFSENIIIEYNLYKNKEIDSNLLELCIKENNIDYYYNLALNYYYKYQKSSHEIKEYLSNKGLDSNNINLIINKLKDKKIINDDSIIDSLIYSLIRNYNGILMIKEKLKAKGFDYNLINNKLNEIDYELYYEYLNKLYLKIKDKYNKESNDYIRINKIKKYLYQRGYTQSDINEINIE